MLRLITNNKSHTYDPLKPDTYLLRLASVSQECGAFFTDDIYNDQGLILVHKDTLVSPQITALIHPHRLKKPLEGCVRLERELTTHQLEQHFIELMQQDDFLVALNEHQDIASLIRQYLPYYEKFPLLRQKISVMALVMPELFLRTISCVWLSLLIAKEMRCSERGCVDIFLAALSHDIGMLHLDMYILEEKGSLSPEDWRHIQEHVFIGATLLKQMPHMPLEVIEAVYEHHERCDGTGYPTGCVESELSYAGKILGLADSVIAIFYNRFKHQHRTWREVILVIQMNAQAYFYRHDEILATLWRRSEMPFKNVVQGDELSEFIGELLREREYLSNWFKVLCDSLLPLGFTHGDRHLHALQNVMLHLSTSVKGSGIFDPELSTWLRQVDLAEDKESYRKIEKAHVQQQEIVFHLQRLNRMMQLYTDRDDCKSTYIKVALLKALEDVNRLVH